MLHRRVFQLLQEGVFTCNRAVRVITKLLLFIRLINIADPYIKFHYRPVEINIKF